MHLNRGRLAREVETLRRSLAQPDELPFADLLPAERVAAACGASPATEPVYSRAVTLWMFLSQVFDADHSCRQAVARLVAWLALRGRPACSAGTGGYCKARQRLDEEDLRRLVIETGQPQPLPDTWRWQGRTVRVVDGTLVNCPDTPANRREYPKPSGSGPGLGFPVIRLVVLFCLATGRVLDAALGPYRGEQTGERSLFRQLWPQLQPGEVVLGDRGFCSYCDLALLAARGVDLVVRGHQSRRTDFRTGQRLGKRDHLIIWTKPRRPTWLDQQIYARLPATLTVREVQTTTVVRGFRSRKIVVITTLLDRRAIPATALSDLYRARWQAEVYLLALQQALQMKELRCHSPEMLRKELWAHLLAYNLIRDLIVQAAQRFGWLPRQISFTGAVQTLVAFHGYLPLAAPDHRAQFYERLLRAIATHRVGQRPNRVEPRAVKRRHRRYPVLSKPRPTARKATPKFP